MFRWYQNAARCYVYLSDVSKPDTGVDDQRELIAPRQVDFFSSEGERLGSKLSLESKIYEVTGIAKKALRGDALSTFSIRERKSWTERHNTTIEEDEVYCLNGIFEVSLVPNYGEGRDQAFRRLEAEIHILYKGVDFDEFAVGLNLESYPEATQFVARGEELSKMHELLQGHSSRSCVLLHGLGGIGKTQLAIAYARRHQEKYTAVFWLNANDENSLKLSFRDVAQQVLRHHPSTSVLLSVSQDKDLDQVVSAVKTWLNSPQNTRWLMIYDNFDNPKTLNNPDGEAVDIRQFLPRSDHGFIITTRSSQVRQGERIHVQKLLDIREGLKILSNMSKRKGIEKDPDAIALVEELDGLPLALSTAGAYLEHVTTSFSDYLRLYRESWLELQMTSPLLDSYENRKLHTTWQITFDRIQQQNGAAAKLLKLWAYFDRQDLWFNLLRHANSADESIQKLTQDELNFNEAIILLCNFGLVNLDPSPQQQVGPGGYSLHSCVHSWTVSVLNKEWDESLARLVLTCVASEVPSIEEKYWWLLQRRLLPHVTRQTPFIVNDKVNMEGLSQVLRHLGKLYIDQGKLAEAEAMYARSLRGYRDPRGQSNNLGSLYTSQGRLALAESMYARTLQRSIEDGYIEEVGPDYLSRLNMISYLGWHRTKQGRLAMTERIYNMALRGIEKAFRLDYKSTLDTVDNLGTIYFYQGKLVEAEKMYNRVLRGYTEALGRDHISTLKTVNNLGFLYSRQGRLAEAEKMYDRALRGYTEALKPDHISTFKTISNLGLLYTRQDRLAEAEAMYARALQGYEAALGHELASSYLPALKIMLALGDLFSQTDRKDMEKEMYNRALFGYASIQGPSSKRCRQLEDWLQAL